MEYIDYDNLDKIKDDLKSKWGQRKHGFGYIVFDGFFKKEVVEEIYSNYPKISDTVWENTTYINQRNKFTKTKFEDSPVFQQVFNELNGERFLKIMEYITNIDQLEGDDLLFGGGLHQSINGAFLDVHVDFNIHEKTKKHRRMNTLVYMNKDWKPEYNGFLELWDMKLNKQIEYVSPDINRCVVFETNEVSFHGHPKKLNTPIGVSRKSIATYYYTNDRPAEEIASEHNTIYVNTEGSKGLVKNVISGTKALIERIFK